MSLLLQALQKAERAKQARLQDAESATPAAQQVLPPAPAGRPAGPVQRAAPSGVHGLSLAPMAGPAMSAAPANGASAPAPAAPQEAAPPVGAADLPGAAPPRPHAEWPQGAGTAGNSARASRLALLAGSVLLIVAGFAYVYFRALATPGPGSRLPMLPMPPAVAVAASPPPAPQSFETAAPRTEPAAPMFSPAPAGVAEIPAAASLAAAEAALPAAPRAAERERRQGEPGNAAVVPAPDEGRIKITHNSAPPPLSPALLGGYQAFNAGDTGSARQQYEAALRQDPNNRDALLGLAAIALRENRAESATALYLRLLQLDPNDNDALAALIGLQHGDPLQSESRLKAILQRNPEAGPVLFALGNLLARQQRWPEAQQVFFRAYSSTPDNADYAFNLAVGLDRLNQGTLAFAYYQRALALGSNNPGSFDRNALRRRLHELGYAAVPGN